MTMTTDAADTLPRLTGVVTLTCTMRALTGLHIGAAETTISIGGMDNPVIRDPITNRPYVPGSSLKGKMRSLLERRLELSQNWPIAQIRIHVCEGREAYTSCRLCQLFGIPAPQRERWFCLTRLRIADAFLTEASEQQLREASTDLPYTEVKTEAAIDRVTSAASPRSMERVPAGAEFGPVRFSLLRYEDDDPALLETLVEGLQLIEADYLGGSGSRGSGRVEFHDISLAEIRFERARRPEPRSFERTFPATADLAAGLDDVTQWLRS